MMQEIAGPEKERRVTNIRLGEGEKPAPSFIVERNNVFSKRRKRGDEEDKRKKSGTRQLRANGEEK